MRAIKFLLLVLLLGAALQAAAQPSIEITNPTDGSTVENGVLLPFWTVSQAPSFAVMRVELYIDGDLVHEYDFQTMDFFNDVFVTHYWRVHGKGAHFLEAVVVDWSGDSGYDSITVFRN